MLELTLSWWQIGLIFIVGVIVGTLAHWYIMRKHFSMEEKEARAEKELSDYQNAVQQHLIKNTELLQQLGTDYDHIVEHLRHGLHDLGKSSLEEGNVVQHFLFSQQQQKNVLDEKESDMPKTYVEPKDKE